MLEKMDHVGKEKFICFPTRGETNSFRLWSHEIHVKVCPRWQWSLRCVPKHSF